MPSEHSERTSMPETEKAKQDRRLLRAIKSGMHRTQLRELGVTDTRIDKLAAEHGLTIAKGMGRRW